ncbi:hypothetical protein AUK04_02595 [Candidatus Roizmanbacteria bacterium CG2_30_33_16]|uniref:PEGA domain-containing protein n=3 Tax=Candidatus Roizmaniibacteriota TaxID=1752723 RepID=A0A2M7E5K8_9BACT|nr:MAG: hypothetical protein AUK04_02595 [Candidatus Roizmanbacteria bacterium CG2_30_33_16]PIP64202.1 MAG: hypothetical protein COW96_03860 [Candidatus Roizmanbacteria bacterium CG22_combo_CG10-13_8_21_14_all_33_16]PIV63003.1 MAG: hypothetical protein COS12_00235 [Candidatus Roizmanbacteria bacterium CG01_land_8_20_14_3_00_33_9]
MIKLLKRIGLFSVFLTILAIIIVYARGYRFNPQKKTVTATGIFSITSWPKAAKIYINGKLESVTDTNITLPYGKYNISVKKEGYTSWNKTIILKGELVETIEAVLFPINASLTPLTNIGITKAIPIEQSDRVLLFSQNNDTLRDGIYIFEANKKPFSFLPPLKLILAKKMLPEDIDFNTVTVNFSPDLKQGLFDFQSVAYLLSLEDDNAQLFDVTISKEALSSAWQDEKTKEIQKILETFPDNLGYTATSSFSLITFSPDKLKFIYQAEQNLTLPTLIKTTLIGTNQTLENRSLVKGNVYIYDKKEDKNYKTTIPNSEFKILNSISWFFDSRHIVLKNDKEIVVSEYDNTNRQIVYSGPFEADFFSVTSEGKLIILVNLNPKNNKLPDLYAVGIR